MVLPSTLTALADFAQLAVAISLAYAGLPNFRYRARVEKHVRDAIEREDGFIENVKANADKICSGECWGVIYRLGRLREWKAGAPEPEAANKNANVDHYFQKTKEYMAFSWLYSSNLDKSVAIGLGAIVGAIIWFSAIGQIWFVPNAKQTDPTWASYLSGVQLFLWASMLLLAAGTLAHAKVWKAELDYTDRRRVIVRSIYRTWVVFFFLGLVAASFDWVPSVPYLNSFIAVHGQLAVFFSTSLITFLAIAIPLFFLVRGQRLTNIIVAETDRCMTEIKHQTARGAAQAGFQDANGNGRHQPIV